MTFNTRCSSREELQGVLEGYHYLLPMIFNVEFIDAPIVEMVTGTVGDIDFSWGILSPDPHAFDATTKELQEQRVQRALRHIPLLSGDGNDGGRRVLAALHWFHVACRLARLGNSPWEFMSEILMNFAKILEVLFPSSANVGTMDAARRGLEGLGLSSTDVEAHYVPAIALRNSIDVAHAMLSVFSQEQLQVLHKYAGQAEAAFRELLTRVLTGIEDGSLILPAYEGGHPSSAAVKVIERMRASEEAHL